MRLGRLVAHRLTLCSACVLLSASANAASLVPLSTFGNGDGWRQPYETVSGDVAGTSVPDPTSPGVNPERYKYLGYALSPDPLNLTSVNAGNLERGMAYNPATGHLLLVSRNGTPTVRVLDGATGADLGALNLGSGVVSGGTFTMNMIGAGDDGAIYLADLTTNTNSAAYKIYRWANESATPTVAFSGQPGTLLAGARIGDSFDVIGSGVNTRMVAGYSSSPSVAGNNSFGLFTTSDGVNFSASNVALSSNPAPVPGAGEFRLGITFKDSTTVIGKSTVNPATVVSLTGSATGDVVSTFPTDGIALRPMDFATVLGKPLVAMVETPTQENPGPPAGSRIFVYDITDTTQPLASWKIGEASALPAGGQFTNLNGTGQVKFGAINNNVATIYALQTNNGIEAFTLTLDLPVQNADFDGNGIVDSGDLGAITANFGVASGATHEQGDANDDGRIDGSDFLVWQQHQGSPSANPVPEPTALLLCLLGIPAISAVRRVF